MKKTTLKRKLFSSIVASVLVCSFVLLPISQTLEVKEANAQLAVFDAAVVTAISATLVPPGVTTAAEQTIATGENIFQTALMSSLQIKEFTLDAIAWGLVNIILEQMIRSVTTWVNSGFQGSPAFVTDLNQFLVDIGDKVAGDFIYGTPLAALCSPFQLNIKLALDLQYQSTRNRTSGYRAQCTLTDVVDNMEGFLDGDFAAGGMNGWFAMTQTPGNNPFGAYMEASAALELSITNTRGDELKLLDFGKLFKTAKDCKPGPTEDSPEICTNTTPGTVIEHTLNKSIDSGQERLTVADEIDELIGALFAQLAGTVLSGAGGLLGLTSSSNGGTGNYFDQMAAAHQTQSSDPAIANLLSSSVTVETKYLALQNQIVSLIQTVPSTCALTPSLTSAFSSAISEVNATKILIGNLSTLNTDYTALINGGNPTLLQKYNGATAEEAIANLVNIFLGYQSSGALHSDGINRQIELSKIPSLKTEIADLTQSCNL